MKIPFSMYGNFSSSPCSCLFIKTKHVLVFLVIVLKVSHHGKHKKLSVYVKQYSSLTCHIVNNGQNAAQISCNILLPQKKTTGILYDLSFISGNSLQEEHHAPTTLNDTPIPYIASTRCNFLFLPAFLYTLSP